MNRKLKIVITSILVVLTISVPGLAQTYFDEHIIDSLTYGTCSLEAPDLDGDGDLDVLGAVQEDNNVVWWRNDGGEPITWTKFVIADNVLEAHSAYAEDLDGDDDLDVIATAYGSSQIYWWRNDGGDPIVWMRFTISNSYNAAHEVYSIDLDDDGDNDVLGASSILHRISWWRNEGGDPIVWNELTIDDNCGMAKSVRVADLDGDSLLDVIGASIQDHDMIWYRNDGGDPIQWTEYLIDGNFGGAHRVQAIDMDYDNDIDIVGAGYLGNQIAWWRNDGGDPVTWVKQTVGVAVMGACVAMAADIDSDGDMDIAGTGQASDEVSWWRNDGEDPIVWVKFTVDNFDRVWPLYISDLNNDGDLDLLAGSSHQGTGEVKWYENLGDVFVAPDFSADPVTGHYPFEVQFTDMTVASPEVNAWAWDFDNDDVIDSYEQFPTWIYDEAGNYTVSLQAFNDSLSRTRTYEDLIHVFNGQSAIEFNGETSFAVCPASQTLNITNALTIEAWIQPYSWGESVNQGFGKIVDKEKFTFFLFRTGSINDHSIVLQLVNESGSTSLIYTPVNSIDLYSWQHVAASYDGVGEVKLYINGDEQTIDQTIPSAGSIQDNLDIDLIIGNNSGNSHTFDGVIDEVRLWNIVRSETEIRAGMNNYINGNAVGLVGNWRIDEGNGDVIGDSSDNDNDGDLFDITWVEGKQLNPTAIDDHSGDVMPRKSQLHMAYPNPFNASTTIYYSLTRLSNVRLEIYDILGRQIESVLDEYRPAGNYQVRWNSERISSGIYFCRLDVDDHSEYIKITLLK
ncbi:MAG: T9SS type A sorting domain-containing protein [candidate division Zixibacteria bacterium]|nr:T9SS type A sorting domain-containing protein [candidate division Zixibacteria bacterium]